MTDYCKNKTFSEDHNLEDELKPLSFYFTVLQVLIHYLR
jgi:hypothetical protein